MHLSWLTEERRRWPTLTCGHGRLLCDASNSHKKVNYCEESRSLGFSVAVKRSGRRTNLRSTTEVYKGPGVLPGAPQHVARLYVTVHPPTAVQCCQPLCHVVQHLYPPRAAFMLLHGACLPTAGNNMLSEYRPSTALMK